MPRQSQSDRPNEKFVPILNSAIYSVKPCSFAELDPAVDNLLLQHSYTAHCATGKSEAQLAKLLCLRSSFYIFLPLMLAFPPSRGIALVHNSTK